MVGTRGVLHLVPQQPCSPASGQEGDHKPPLLGPAGWRGGRSGQGPLLCWRWGLHALEHERCPVLGKQRAACVHKVARGVGERGQMEEGVPG